MSSVLVHGAAGFVAHSLLPLLVSHGHKTLVLVDRKRIPSLLVERLRSAGAEIEEVVSDRLTAIRDRNNITSAVCLASSTSVDAALADPAPAIEGNVQVAIDFCEWVRGCRHAVRGIYLSSDEVLGESSVPLAEDSPLRPTQPYAASKAAAEIILNTYREVYKLDLVTLRSCNLVGPHQKEPKLIPVSVRRLMQDLEVPIHGSGEQLREWMAVHDLCQAILVLLNRSLGIGVFQAASSVHLSVNQVVRIVAEALRVTLRTVHVEDRMVQDHCYAMQCERLLGLGWQPIINPGDAIREATLSLAETVRDPDSNIVLPPESDAG